MKYRLNKAETVPVTLYHVARTKAVNDKDIVTYNNYLRLAPGEEYESDDTAMLNWLKSYTRKVKYTRDLEALLQTNGVPFETEMCKSCGGRVKKIKYQLVEVYDE